MDVHKPKPIRSWRELLTEIGVIVLGVCIALAAEQGVEWWHWRQQVTEARQAITRELVGIMFNGRERLHVQLCAEQRLDRLATILDQASRSGSLPPVPQIGQVPSRLWPDDVWRTVVASQTATHFPRDELTRIGAIYGDVQVLNATNREELLEWANLSAMAGPGRRLDPASDAELRKALSQARYYSRFMALAGGQTVKQIERLNLPFTADEQRRIEGSSLGRVRLCEPLKADVPALYGQAPLNGAVDTIRDWQKAYAEKAKH